MGMKIIKLNRRHKQFKEHGHTIALRFDSYEPKKVAAHEKVCRARFLSHGYNRDANWWSGFGHAPNSNCPRPYWITFRNEMDLTLVLLSADLTN
jgi:hypothetical protein